MAETTVILWLSDLHSGSPVSLYPNEVLPLLSGPRGPSALQVQLYRHYIEVLQHVRLMKDEMQARLVVIAMGDLCEGLHHGSQEIISPYLTDHMKIAETLLRECKEITQYDTIYFIDGTPAHAGENEYNLAEVLMGERYAPGQFTWPTLRKKIHGNLIYAAHQGPGTGRGINTGNPLRSWMKTTHYEMTMTGQAPPDMFVFGHRHVHQHERIEIAGHTTDGFLLPSWKLLDGFVNRVNPFAFPNIGSMVSVCDASGITSEFLTIHINQSKVSEL